MSEFRQDITSGDWVIIAPGRAKRPEELVSKKQPRKPAPKKTCPFEIENLRKSKSQWPPLAVWPLLRGASEGIADEKIIPSSAEGGSASGERSPSERGRTPESEIIVVPNKYPALSCAPVCAMDDSHGAYRMKTGVGEHELVITRDHSKTFADIDGRTAGKLFEMFQERHRTFAKDPCIAYASTFFNWGSWAGASIWHPHYQILGIPIIPPHVAHSLRGSKKYFRKHRRCVRCATLKFELAEKKRVVAKNAHAVAFTPYASKHPFEVSIFPRVHVPSFSHTPAAVVQGVARLLQDVLRSMKKNLHDPDYNVFIHGAPLDYKKYPHHHWHVEILPKTTISAGFEFATEIDINVIDPDDAARILRR
jgi:UDPglucose--hexose-1-phosphate uridylyltransferase